jgi:hypothetical protein
MVPSLIPRRAGFVLLNHSKEFDMSRIYFRAMAIYWLGFGLVTTFYPRLMQLFMTQRGVESSTAFSDQVWLHGGLDILSVSLLLFACSAMPAATTTLRTAATVALLPTAAIAYTLAATPFWSPLFLVPAAGTLAFAVWGFALAHRAASGQPTATAIGHDAIPLVPERPHR